ncbi:MAG TPA: D-alanyl-D-alanine carboxypeptidase/D-alanyl-D-alanine-endopeptidase [Jatrophihabitans sp.]|nr:D-alanyl-D-alanine carboxypeptidase/D-alanyl-D-alanine-endopeptidase [Jatrophihabitans sp.]
MTVPRTRRRPAGLAVLLACLLAVAGYFAVGGTRQYLANRNYHPIPVPAASPPAADVGHALSTAAPAAVPTAVAAPEPTPAGVAAALAEPLAAADLGPSVSAQVLDAVTGDTLFSRRADALVAPASTSKLATAAAVLTVHRPTDRFGTRVVAGADPHTVVLVGGGDPTLSAAPSGQAPAYPEAGRISDLAAKVRTALGGTPVTQVLVDDSLFTGPATAPGWAPEDSPSSYACPITAAMVDGGRDTPDATIRSAAPDLAAGNALARALGGAQVALGSAPSGARVLGTVQSAPVGVLVEQMLRDSDNVLAEVLGRQVALSAHQPASFAGAAAAVRSTVTGLGIPAGDGMRDASGLSVLDRMPADALSQVLVHAESGNDKQLWPILSGLSVAGWDGSLVEQGRFTGPAAAADGAVRAKTGSLTGVSAMVGVLTDADGRQLIFAFVADRAPSEGPTRVAIDDLAAALVGCGCR